MGFFLQRDVGHRGAEAANLRCPECGQNGSFEPLPNIHDVSWQEIVERDGKKHAMTAYGGARRCPNLECRALVFIVQLPYQKVQSFPPEVLDFDATNLPPDIQASLVEAIKCHSAGCYRAAALMVRRVLEELCKHQSAKGKDLKARIAALYSVAIVPPALLTAADELRILGNDAAHVEAKDYDAITANEAELAIELAKELLKAVYQYSDLVARLQALKKSP